MSLSTVRSTEMSQGLDSSSFITPVAGATGRERKPRCRRVSLEDEASLVTISCATLPTETRPVPKKPKHPLTAYNLFFRAERARLLGLDPEQAVSARKRHKSHKKTHGKISFSEMGKRIGENWRNLDEAGRAMYKTEAAVESRRYKKEMDVYKRDLLRITTVGSEDRGTPTQANGGKADECIVPTSIMPEAELSSPERTLPDHHDVMKLAMDIFNADPLPFHPSGDDSLAENEPFTSDALDILLGSDLQHFFPSQGTISDSLHGPNGVHQMHSSTMMNANEAAGEGVNDGQGRLAETHYRALPFRSGSDISKEYNCDWQTDFHTFLEPINLSDVFGEEFRVCTDTRKRARAA